MHRDQRQLVRVGFVGILVGDECGFLEESIEGIVGRKVVVARRDLAQFEKVGPALLTVLGTVREHRAIAGSLEHLVDEFRQSQGSDPGSKPSDQADEVTDRCLGPSGELRHSTLGGKLESHPVGQVLPSGRGPDHLDGLVPDRPGRHVDDPLVTDGVGVRTQDPQVGQRVLDLLPSVEARTADHLVADPVAEAGFLDRPGLRVRPIQDGDVAQVEGPRAVIGASRQRGTAATRQLLDAPGDPLGLLLLVVGLEPIDELAAVVLRPELLVRPSLVPGNDRVRGIEDDLGRAVVLFEFHDRRIRPVALEVENVPDIRAAPAVDRLVVVPDDRQVVVTGGEGLDPEVLRPVRVLVLVDVEVAPTFLVLLEGRRRFLEEPERLEEEVVEVEGIRALERVPIFTRQPRDLDQRARGDPHRRNLGRVHHVVLGAADRTENGLWTCFALGLHALLAQDLLHELVLVVRVVDQEPSIEANRLAIAPEQACTQGMERAGLDLLARLSNEPDDPLAELSRGPIRERHGQDPPG